jgi:hypothetical protein
VIQPPTDADRRLSAKWDALPHGFRVGFLSLLAAVPAEYIPALADARWCFLPASLQTRLQPLIEKGPPCT